MLMNADWLTLFSLAKRPWKKKPSKTAHFQSVSTLYCNQTPQKICGSMTRSAKAAGRAGTSPLTRLCWWFPLLTAVGYQRKMNSDEGFHDSWAIRNPSTFTVWEKPQGEPDIYTHLEVMSHLLLQAKMGQRGLVERQDFDLYYDLYYCPAVKQTWCQWWPQMEQQQGSFTPPRDGGIGKG